MPAVRRFFQTNVGQRLGLDIENFVNGEGRAEPCDLAVSEFIKQGGSWRLLWYIVREKQLLTEVQKESKLDNDDALSNAQSSMSTASAGGASVSSKTADYDSAASQSTTSSTAQQQRMIVSTDQLHSLEQYNCVYFLRDLADPSPISEADVCSRVTCGVIREGRVQMPGAVTVSLDMLGTLTENIRHLYMPVLKSKNDFGELTSYLPGRSVASVPEVTAFLAKVEQFRVGMQFIIDSLAHTVPLQKPMRRFCIDFNAKSFAKAGMKREVVECYEATVGLWIKKVARVLSQGVQDVPAVEPSQEPSHFGDDDGPDVELEFWNKRTTLLNHITDNLQLKANKVIIGVLHAAGARSAPVLQEWAEVETRVTEAASEAKDNGKYLHTLEKFAEPLHAEEPDMRSIKLSIPAIINVIRMIHSISKYYNTSEKLTGLFLKVTNQIIRCCRTYLERNGCVWDQVPEAAVHNLRECIELKEIYVSHYRQTKGELAANPLGPQFDFSEASIFGKFDLFCVRLSKLIDVMHVTRQFDKLMLANIENIQPLCATYTDILHTLRSNAGEYLEARRRDFDNLYQDYKFRVQELSTELVVFLNNCFLTVTNTSKALQLLSRFRAVINNTQITKLLEEKHSTIFISYGRDLEALKAVYERHKENPPSHRDTPPVAGAISWVRQLQRKIEEPMKIFKETPELLQSRDARRIIKTYNRVAKTLITYENRWYEAWATRLVEDAKEGLQATLLVCDKATSRVYVNFDISIKQLCREVHFLMRLGLPIPAEARSIHSQKQALLHYCEELHYMVDRYYRLLDSVEKVHGGIVIPHINRLNMAINPGLVQLTWTSLNVGHFIREVSGMLTDVETTVQRVNGILKHRIDVCFEQVKRMSFVCLAEDLTQPNTQPIPAHTLPELLALQKRYAKTISQRLNVLNCEVATATREIVAITTNDFTADELQSVQEATTELYNNFEHEVFQSLLFAMQQSVLYLKSRITGPVSRGSTGPSTFLHPVPTVFHVELVVKLRSVEFSPSLEELQKCVNKIARSILETTRGVYRWKQDGRPPHTYDIVEYQAAVLRTEEGSRALENESRLLEFSDSGSDADGVEISKSKLKSLFLRIGKNRKMTKVFLQLTGAVSSLQEHLSSFLHQFHFYEALLRGNRANVLESFTAEQRTFEEYEEHIRTFHALEREITFMPNTHGMGCLEIDLVRIKAFLTEEAQEWKVAYGTSLNQHVRSEMDVLIRSMEDIQAKLNRKVHDLSDVNSIMTVISKLRLEESEIDMKLQPIVAAYDTLYKYNVAVTKEEQDQVDRIGFQWNDLAAQSRRIMDQLQEVGPRFKSVLLTDVAEFQVQVQTFKQDYDRNGPMAEHIEPRLAVERLKLFDKQFVECKRKLTEYSMGEQLFGLPQTRYREVEQIEKELRLLTKLYDLFTEVLAKKAGFEEMPWIELDLDKMRTAVQAYHGRVRKMPASIRDWRGYQDLRSTVDELLDTIPILELLSSKCVVARHWEQLSQATGTPLNPRLPEFRLKHLLEAKLCHVRSEIEEITNAAQKEFDIEVKLSKIKEEWLEREVTLAPFKKRGLLMLKPDATSELISRVEEAQSVLTTLLSSRFNEPFKKEIMLWISKLTTTQERISDWLEVQHLWVYMAAVFSGSGDIGKEMPAEVKRFSNIDRQWAKIMKGAAEAPNALKLCVHSDMLSNLLPHLRLYLDMCQKSLSGYLSNKRKVQPRFFFVSNSQLLEILGQASNPATVQEHLYSITNNMQSLVFDNDKNVVAYRSGEGEEVRLESAVSTECEVIDWIQELLDESVSTLRHRTRQMLLDLPSLDLAPSSASSSVANPLKAFHQAYPSQVALLGLQLLWTMDCEFALTMQKTEKGAVSGKMRKHKSIYENLIHQVREPDLAPSVRLSLESLITVQAHQYDVVVTLQKSFKKVRSTSDFEWLKQCRFYWKVDRDSCVGSITDVDFEYGFEYIGRVERLVVTDLTDRIYISSAQAIGMGYGGAPLGPAGTGKTETLKGMGRAFGRYVIVMNCSLQMTMHTMANVFKGTATSGCWCVFDEINRVSVGVLSVVASQVACVLHGRRNRQAEVCFPDDTIVKLSPRASIFVTLNPTHGKDLRAGLPENMKALFRSIAAVIPDRHTIIRVRLAAAGFADAQVLAKKFSVLYTLCEEQLGPHRHYDFGLRNVLSVLRRCAQLMQEQTHALRSPRPVGVPPALRHVDIDGVTERNMLTSVLLEANLSKLVDEDALLFSDLLADIFPAHEMRRPRAGTLQQAITKEISSCDYSHAPEWVMRILQINEQLAARCGVCVIGPSAGGKSTALAVLAQAKSAGEAVQVRVNRVNPKTISVQELYGRHDAQTGDWSDGIFTALWRRASRRSDVAAWILLDGPVDPLWVESLNTVLDDTKLLTIPNNERLSLPTNLSLLFEVEDVRNASPATVSRLGMVYMGTRCLKWVACVEAWLAKHHQVLRTHAHIILELYNTHIPGLLACAKKECKLSMPVSDQLLVLNVLKLNEGLHCESQGRMSNPQTLLTRTSLFAMAWGIGGAMEDPCRERIHACLAEAEADVPPTSIFSHYVDASTGKWARWQVEPAHLAGAEARLAASLHQAFVPTEHSLRLEYVLQTASKRLSNYPTEMRNVLLIGKAGVGKTAQIMSYMNRAARENTGNICKRLCLSSASSPRGLQASIESFVDRISGSNWGPPPGNVLHIFVDDLCLPARDACGDQTTLELVRQVVDDGFCYSRAKLESAEKLVFACTQLVAAADHLAAATDLPSRLKQHFFFVNATLPSVTTLDYIYTTLLAAHFTADAFCDEVTEAVPALVSCARQTWEGVRAALAPVPGKEHYTFSLRDLASVALGMTKATPQAVPSRTRLLDLYECEARRVFADRAAEEDVAAVSECCAAAVEAHFGVEARRALRYGDNMWVHTVKQGLDLDDLTAFQPTPPYEPSTSEEVAERLQGFLAVYNQGSMQRTLTPTMVSVAVTHLLRIERCLRTPRASMLLVGATGSGRRRLTRLAAFVSGHKLVELRSDPSYTYSTFMEDLREVHKHTAIVSPVTILASEHSVDNERILDVVNMLLSGADVTGLHLKDELELLYEELEPYVAEEDLEGGQAPSLEALHKTYAARVWDNLHFVLYFSSVSSEGFRSKTARFPSLLKCCSMNLFHSWPEAALVREATEALRPLATSQHARSPFDKAGMAAHAGRMHTAVQRAAQRYRKGGGGGGGGAWPSIVVPPGSYAEYVETFVERYTERLAELDEVQAAVGSGLQTLEEAHDDVASMKRALGTKHMMLQRAAEQMHGLQSDVQQQAAAADEQTRAVEQSRRELAAQAARVQEEKDEAAAQLAAAEPAMRVAEDALMTIKQDDLATLKRLINAPPLIRRICDGVLILRNMPLEAPTQWETDASGTRMVKPSWAQGKSMIMEPRFLQSLQDFPKDTVNAEHCELLMPYLQMDDFNVERAKSGCGSLAGLCTWLSMMTVYHQFAKSIAPKRARLALAETQLYKAKQLLVKSDQQLSIKQLELKDMRGRLDAALGEQSDMQADAETTQRRLGCAEALLGGLDCEKERWMHQTQQSLDQVNTLAGNTAKVALFLTYCAPFNQRHRAAILAMCEADLGERSIASSPDLEPLLMTDRQRRTCALEGLPLDEHSLQNACIVKHAARSLLLIDPQGQALRWLVNANNQKGVYLVGLGSKDWMRALLQGIREGKCVIIQGVESELPRCLDQVLAGDFAKATLLDGTTVRIVRVGEQEVEVGEGFEVVFTASTANPRLHPDTFAKLKTVDFSVTLEGLTEQLLHAVIRHEKPSLEEDRVGLLEEILVCDGVVAECEEILLTRLAQRAGGGRLLEDEQLIEVLASTKAKSNEIHERLKGCRETTDKIEQAREVYRPVAQRGAVIYFSVAEMACLQRLYHHSLQQFLANFKLAVAAAPANQYPPIRVQNVVAHLTQHMYRSLRRGYYAADKRLFTLLLAIGVELQAGGVVQTEVDALVTAQSLAALPECRQQKLDACPWLAPDRYAMLVFLDKEVEALSTLKASVRTNEAPWHEWQSLPAPEAAALPYLEDRVTLFHKLLIVNALRPDRVAAAVVNFATPVLGGALAAMERTALEQVVQCSGPGEPILCLLSPGMDPASTIDCLARKHRVALTQVSMGVGQEALAMRHVAQALQDGTWILLQNVHLCVAFLEDLAVKLRQMKTEKSSLCRVWLTTQPSPDFPVSVLNCCVKVALEPPAGMKAGLAQSFQHITQDQLDSIHQREWRLLLYTLCFFHAAVIERNRFAGMGWSAPYEFSNHDLIASTAFLYNYLYADSKKGVLWTTVQFMVCGVQYGGRVTDPFDMQILTSLGERWFVEDLLDVYGFSYHPGYKAADLSSVAEYQDFIARLPDEDSAEVFGLHTAAEVEANTTASQTLVESLMLVRAHGETALQQLLPEPGTRAREETEHFVLRTCREVRHELARAVESLPTPTQPATTPFALFIRREVARLRTLVEEVVASCGSMKLALAGQAPLTPDLQNMFDRLSLGNVPACWEARSWGSNGVGAWVEHALRRIEQYAMCLLHGRPRSFWLPGFFHPQALLTVFRQEYVRPHLPNATLDQVELRAELTKYSTPPDTTVLEEGSHYLNGLYLVAAAWDKNSGTIVDPSDGSVYNSLPVVRLSCTLGSAGDTRCFQCPVFRDSARGSAGHIFSVSIKVRCRTALPLASHLVLFPPSHLHTHRLTNPSKTGS